jgi:capsular polysaccharide transport system permease protein
MSSKPKKSALGKILFFLLVFLPTIAVSVYYSSYASDQYRSELRFSVRGVESSPLDALGLGAIPGATTQAADAYIVIDYINSKQIISDIKEKLHIDLREKFSKTEIDSLYKIKKDMSLDEFVYYWKWMINADFNSTTGITTFEVTAFTADDAQQIAKAVLDVTTNLVNGLSSAARVQLIEFAQGEVNRTEARLGQARKAITEFRNLEQSLDPTLTAKSGQAITETLEKEIIDLKARKAALVGSLNQNSPSMRVIDRQIAALSTELELKRKDVGTGTTDNLKGNNLSSVVAEYASLAVEQDFAEKTYTTTLAALESAQAEARKRARYFAIVVNPTRQDAAIFPLRLLNIFIFFISACVIWLTVYLIWQSVRDHSV